MKKLFTFASISLLAISLLSCDKKEETTTDTDAKQEETTSSILKDTSGNTLLDLNNSYYSTIGGTLENKTSFKNSLHALVEQSHTKHLTYKECWTALESADEDPDNSNNVYCIYSGLSMPKENHVGNSGSYGYWNREHLFPQSRGFKTNSAIAHNDIHHLRAAEYTTNSSRGDTDFGEGGNYFTPRAEVRGDIARALLYMTVRYEADDYTAYKYNGIAYTDSDDLDLELAVGTSNSSPISTGEYVVGSLDFLIKWNYEDPVSEEEKKRNEVVFSIQGNRNPFIDYNDFVAYLYPEYAKEYTDISKIEYLL